MKKVTNLKNKICGILALLIVHSLCGLSLKEQFKQSGYVELPNEKQGTATFEKLYASFDKVIDFFQTNPKWAHKLLVAKERFIRSKERNYYVTDFFGLYDESKRVERGQISFYYSIHFHDFICTHYPEFNQIPEIINFLETCREVQKPYGTIFHETATALDLETIFSSEYVHPPLLLKVVKYLPSYVATTPHYDGTAFSLFLDSTDNQSLLLAPYTATFTTHDFFSPVRTCSRTYHTNSLLLIPGTLLTEFSIYPTPHIVLQSGETRYATIAFAMRPHYNAPKNSFSLLPNFKKIE